MSDTPNDNGKKNAEKTVKTVKFAVISKHPVAYQDNMLHPGMDYDLPEDHPRTIELREIGCISLKSDKK